MKQRELIKKMEYAGFIFYRHGGNHDIYICGNKIERMQRNKETIDDVARVVVRKWDMDK